MTGESADDDGGKAKSDSEEDHLARTVADDFVHLAGEEWGDKGSESGTEAERNGVAERDAEIADAETEEEAADAPHGSPEPGVEGDAAVDTAEYGHDVWDEGCGEEDGDDDPAKNALDNPVDLPRPALDSAEGKVATRGGKSAGPMIENAQKRIRVQEKPSRRWAMLTQKLQRLRVRSWRVGFRYIAHKTVPVVGLRTLIVLWECCVI